MPQPQNITRAKLREIRWTADGQVEDIPGKDPFDVQFNPASLSVTYANQRAGGDQGSPIQFVGRGNTKLDLELLFDVTSGLRDAAGEDDVRALSQRVTALIKPDDSDQIATDDNTVQFLPPGVRFEWGAFLFEGIVDSVAETLDFFSPEGKPLRSTLRLSISRQDIQITPVSGGAGTTPQTQASAGDSVQQLAASAGLGVEWKGVAAANGIENPRQLEAGALVDLNASVNVSASTRIGF